jgi:very-short-patch-repair endonuclease
MGISSEDYKKLLDNVKSKGKSLAPKVTRKVVAPKRKTKHSKADYKERMWAAMNSVIDGWETEFKFHPKRKWRADWYNKKLSVLVEYEGIYGGASRHTNVTGYTKDAEKYNQAQILGYTVLRYTASNYEQLTSDLKEIIKNG